MVDGTTFAHSTFLRFGTREELACNPSIVEFWEKYCPNPAPFRHKPTKN